MPLQLHQNINLFLLLILGVLTADIYLSLVDIFLILLFTLVVEHLFLYFNEERNFYFSYSAFSTSIGVIVLLYSSSLWIYFLVIACGLAQKHFLTIRGKHLFNPSNFSVVIMLIFFYNDAHIVTGQLGDEPLLAMVVSVLAMSILVRAKRWIIPLVFVMSYLSLEYLLVVTYDPVVIFQDIYHRFYSVTFILFVYFMLTDPPVTPSNWKLQILFGFFVAILATLLDRFYGYRVQHLFISLFFFSFFVNLFPLRMLSPSQLKFVLIILLMIIGGVGFVEMQPPYYFEMNG